MAAMLDEIIEATRARVARLDYAGLRSQAGDAPPARSFAAALAGPEVDVIAEVKRRSPSRGTLAADLDPARRSALYAAGGAAAISVLTTLVGLLFGAVALAVGAATGRVRVAVYGAVGAALASHLL